MKYERQRLLLGYLLAYGAVVMVYRAIPFLSIPTLGQVVWISGFAKSFVNAGWPYIKAVNFGIPAQAPIAFGLAGTLLESLLIQIFKLPAYDAYAFGALIWLFVALVGAISFAGMLGTSRTRAPYFALIYMTLPVVWVHAGYSMLSFGFALLPLYVFSAFRIVYHFHEKSRAFFARGLDILLFVFVSFLAIFMDGYTYVMFCCATFIVFVTAFLRGDGSRVQLLVVTAPVICISGALSCLAYAHYVGTFGFSPAPMDFLRGWGVDIVMLLIPSKNVSWLCDLLHVSVARSFREFFGDGSVWASTFCAPLLLFGALGFCVGRLHRFATPLLLISAVAFYFALGPSLKINSLRPANERKDGSESPLMPDQFAVMPTGSALLYANVPGLKSMRAPYRWCALSFVGLFGLTILLLEELFKRKRVGAACCVVVLLIATNIPNLPRRLVDSIRYREAMKRMISDLGPLNNDVGRGRRAVFYPQGNDFLATFLSSEGNYYTYNVGGDKNVELARRSWPSPVVVFFSAPFDGCLEFEIARILLSGKADCVVIPYFNMKWHAFEWPPDEKSVKEIEKAGFFLETASKVKTRYGSLISRLSKDANFDVKDTDLYAVISLSTAVAKSVLTTIEKGVPVTFEKCSQGLLCLRSGWSVAEQCGTWSDGDVATMAMRVKGGSQQDLAMTIESFALVNERHPLQEVEVDVNGHFVKTLKFTSSSRVSNVLTVSKAYCSQNDGMLNTEFKIKDPTSPAELGISTDSRKLGMYLMSLKVDPVPDSH
jgi:hypothetical protein